VLCHALESYTARPVTRRAPPVPATARPMSQGANPWSDLGCREALRIIGANLVRGVHDPADDEAREQLMWAATLAGIAFGNAGVHVPHAMAYAIAGRVRDYRPPGYPDDAPLVPHGFAVALGAPACFRTFAPTAPARHLEAAALLGANVTGAADVDAGELVADIVAALMSASGTPITTRWMDNDIYGHVNNVTYYSYFDSAANAFLIAAGLDIHAGPVIGLVVESACQYHAPIAYPAPLRAGLRVDRLGQRAVTYGLAIFRADDERAVAHGHFVHVFVDRATRTPTAIPAPLRAALERIVVVTP
jgi:YbgC/YbaW family acyl-CoA thioester hydrolase